MAAAAQAIIIMASPRKQKHIHLSEEELKVVERYQLTSQKQEEVRLLGLAVATVPMCFCLKVWDTRTV